MDTFFHQESFGDYADTLKSVSGYLFFKHDYNNEG